MIKKTLTKLFHPADYREDQLNTIVNILFSKDMPELAQEAMQKLADNSLTVEEKLEVLKAELERLQKQVDTTEVEKAVLDSQFDSIKEYMTNKIST